MCGRYYVDDETAGEIERIVRTMDEKKKNAHSVTVQAGDIHPTDFAPVLFGERDGKISCEMQKWGFPGFDRTKVIFNARSESAMEKRMFQESVEKRRIVVPATWFYEWNRNREKYVFYRKEQPVLFMAGIYNRYQDENRFVILTTNANASMSPVHDRMPLILEPEEIRDWMFESQKTGQFLCKVPCLLDKRTEFEQMSLF